MYGGEGSVTYFGSSDVSQDFQMFSHTRKMFIHQNEQRHGPGSVPKHLEVLADIGIWFTEKVGPQVNDILMRR